MQLVGEGEEEEEAEAEWAVQEGDVERAWGIATVLFDVRAPPCRGSEAFSGLA